MSNKKNLESMRQLDWYPPHQTPTSHYRMIIRAKREPQKGGGESTTIIISHRNMGKLFCNAAHVWMFVKPTGT